jgi:hypothetical protein
MARYTKITKISESNNTHVYEICNNSSIAACYALLDGTNKIIKSQNTTAESGGLMGVIVSKTIG